MANASADPSELARAKAKELLERINKNEEVSKEERFDAISDIIRHSTMDWQYDEELVLISEIVLGKQSE